MSTSHRGVALVTVLWIMAILAVMGIGFSFSVRVNADLTANAFRQVKAGELAHAGLEITIERMKADQAQGKTYMALTDPWMSYSSNDIELPFDAGQFTVNVMDEAGKLNVNVASVEEIGSLVGDEELANSIMDWRDEDDDSTDGGAETFVYEEKKPPYKARNGRLRSIGELGLVEGMTSQLLWGDPQKLYNERQLGEVRGLADVLTVCAIDPNYTATGQRRLDLNTATDNELREGLQGIIADEKIEAIIDYRSQFRGSSGGTGGTGGNGGTDGSGMPGGITIPGGGGTDGRMGVGAYDLTRRYSPPVGARQAGGPDEGDMGTGMPDLGTITPPGSESSPIGGTGTQEAFPTTGALVAVPELANEDIEAVWDYVSAADGDLSEGRININTAPLQVLSAIIDPALAQAIVDYRDTLGAYPTVAHILEAGPDVKAQFESISDRLTATSYVFTIESTGHIARTGIATRLRATVDVSGDQPNYLLICQY